MLSEWYLSKAKVMRAEASCIFCGIALLPVLQHPSTSTPRRAKPARPGSPDSRLNDARSGWRPYWHQREHLIRIRLRKRAGIEPRRPVGVMFNLESGPEEQTR